MTLTILVLSVILYLTSSTRSQVIQHDVNYKEIKCLVCQSVVSEIEKSVLKENPLKKVEVGNYRLDGKGNQKQKLIEYRRSEGFLNELMDDVCGKMENYVKAKHKTTGEIIVMSLMSDGHMNPLMSEVDIITDETLNSNLKQYCHEIVEYQDDSIISNFQNEVENPVYRSCDEVCENKKWLKNYEPHEEL